jgi:hypothetical protein
MSRAKGLPKTGGRKKGKRNKKTEAREIVLADPALANLAPVDFMLAVMRTTAFTVAVRLDAAAKAAPYRHHKLVAVENLHRNEPPVNTAKSASQLRHELIAELVKYGYLKPIEPPQQIEGVAEPAGIANPVEKGNRSA